MDTMETVRNGRAEPLHYIAELHSSCYAQDNRFFLIVLTVIDYHFSTRPRILLQPSQTANDS